MKQKVPFFIPHPSSLPMRTGKENSNAKRGKADLTRRHTGPGLRWGPWSVPARRRRVGLSTRFRARWGRAVAPRSRATQEGCEGGLRHHGGREARRGEQGVGAGRPPAEPVRGRRAESWGCENRRGVSRRGRQGRLK